MERSTIRERILSAPAWARVGLTVRDERLRERAADELAKAIAAPCRENRDQLALPLR